MRARWPNAIGTDHHEVIVAMDDFFNALPQLVWHEDEPITWPSSVCLYFVSKLASQQVKVVLTGEGSDEMFGGYGRYHFYDVNQRWLRYYGVAATGLAKGHTGSGGGHRLLSANLRRKLQHTFVGREESFEALYLDNFYCAFPASSERSCIRRLPALLEALTEGWAPAFAASMCTRSENLPGGTAHEAGPDEHGHLHRKPGAVFGSRVRGILDAGSGGAENAGRRGQSTS